MCALAAVICAAPPNKKPGEPELPGSIINNTEVFRERMLHIEVILRLRFSAVFIRRDRPGQMKNPEARGAPGENRQIPIYTPKRAI